LSGTYPVDLAVDWHAASTKIAVPATRDIVIMRSNFPTSYTSTPCGLRRPASPQHMVVTIMGQFTFAFSPSGGRHHLDFVREFSSRNQTVGKGHAI
jgi:hypothetical protein